MLKDYKDLTVWQKSFQLCLDVYKITKEFPKEELYGLTSQIRRSAVSVPSNIAESYGRKTKPEYIQFLHVAYGSSFELETQLMLSGDLQYVKTERVKKILEGITEVEKMLRALIKSLKDRG